MPKPIGIPKEFWKDLSGEEFDEIVRSGRLSAVQLQRLRKLLGREYPAPADNEE